MPGTVTQLYDEAKVHDTPFLCLLIGLELYQLGYTLRQKIIFKVNLDSWQCFWSARGSYATIDIWISRLLVGLHSQFTVHQQKWCYLPTRKHQADWPEKLYWPGQILPLLPVFRCEWVISATFQYTWTNGETQTNQLSSLLDVYVCNTSPSCNILSSGVT